MPRKGQIKYPTYPGKKFCPKCKKHKDTSEFHKSSSRAGGLGPWCKDCRNEYDRVRMHERGKAERLEVTARYIRRFRMYKRHDKKVGREFSLTIEQFAELIDGECEYCGKKPADGIDRVDSSKGHTPDNCVSCCFRCNAAKRDYSLEDFKDWIDRVHSRLYA